ncbi:malonic semialdehyde reductase [Pelomyxa schiedti]|nr:malonic semialdehyde reductase [Pelomyxa schiedti]
MATSTSASETTSTTTSQTTPAEIQPTFDIRCDADKCVKCGLCVKDCVNRCISMPPGENPRLSSAANCIKCGHCVAVCPKSALTFSNKPIEDFPPIDPSLCLSTAQVEQFIRSRRSCRVYKPGPIDQTKVMRLLELCHHAASAGNAQQVQYIVLHTPEQLHRFGQHTIDWLKAASGHPAAERISSAWDKGFDPIFRKAPCVILGVIDPATSPKQYHHLGVVDVSIALANMELAAPSLGLGTCWAGFFQGAVAAWEPLKAELGGKLCLGALMVGEPQLKYQRMVARNPLVVQWL